MSRSTSKDKDKMQDLGTVMLCSMAEMGGDDSQTASGLASPATSSTQMVLVSVPLGGLVGVA